MLRIPHFTVMTILLLGLSLLQGCMQQKKQDPYKEGDIVTWKINDHLILKAEVGQRREHVVTRTPRGEAEFYRPQYERYIGQFPIDYQPTRFAKISEVEAIDMPISKASRGYEFNLMLNSSTVQATDEIVESSYALDHPDQVKVVLTPRSSKTNTAESYRLTQKETYFGDIKHPHETHGLECYIDKRTEGLNCFGRSTNPKISGVFLKFFNEHWVVGESYGESAYGGIEILWRFDSKNIERWQEIDTAIWRLLDTWNISPFETMQDTK